MVNVIENNIAKVVPLKFENTTQENFEEMLTLVAENYQEEMDVLPYKTLSDAVPKEADAGAEIPCFSGYSGRWADTGEV